MRASNDVLGVGESQLTVSGREYAGAMVLVRTHRHTLAGLIVFLALILLVAG